MLLQLEKLSKKYPRGPEIVRDISLSVDRGETVAVFGESGSGKTTIGQMAAGILRPTSGEVFFQGQRITEPFRGEARRRIQILFQHPEVSFNPRMKLSESMREPYRFFSLPYTHEAHCSNLKDFGIYEEHLERYPAQLSGGELQRMALARLMLLEPQFIVLDEPTSMLDVISQAQVIGLLRELQQQRGLGYLFISHDILLCQQFCNRIFYLTNGVLSETKPSGDSLKGVLPERIAR